MDEGHAEEFEGGITLRKGRPYDPAWDAWQPRRRWPGIIVSAIVVAGFIGALAFKYSAKVAAPPSTFPTQSQNQIKPVYFPPVAPGSAQLQQISGTKSASSLHFHSTGKLMIWYFQCHCVTNFGVIVHDSTGAVIDVPLNTTGKSTISTPAQYPAGDLSVGVIADRQWTISLIDPSSLPTMKLPYSYLSGGESILGPFSSRSMTLDLGFIGAIGNHFTMTMSDGTLSTPKLWAIDSQSFSKHLELSNLPDKYWLIVNGEGLWQIKAK